MLGGPYGAIARQNPDQPPACPEGARRRGRHDVRRLSRALTGFLLLGFAAFGGAGIGTSVLTGSVSGEAVALTGAAATGASLCAPLCSVFPSLSSFFTCAQLRPRSSERNNPLLVPA